MEPQPDPTAEWTATDVLGPLAGAGAISFSVGVAFGLVRAAASPPSSRPGGHGTTPASGPASSAAAAPASATRPMLPGNSPADLSSLTSRPSPHVAHDMPPLPRGAGVRMALGALAAGSALALLAVGSTLAALSAATGVSDLDGLRDYVHTVARPAVADSVASITASIRTIVPGPTPPPPSTNANAGPDHP